MSTVAFQTNLTFQLKKDRQTDLQHWALQELSLIIIKSFNSLWSVGHPWRASRHCGLQLSPSPCSMIFLCFLSHPLLPFATFSSVYLSFYIPEDSNLMVFTVAPVSLRNVCPIQFHFLLFIWFSIDFSWVILHSSSFIILLVHFILIIRLKHLFTNICSLLVIWLAVFQVSQTYNNNDFTFSSTLHDFNIRRMLVTSRATWFTRTPHFIHTLRLRI